MVAPTIYTVKQFNELVNAVLSEAIGEVTISGEVSNFKISQGKWVSFDIKDGESVLNCFMSLYQLDFPIADGNEILVTGIPRIYVPYGKYSLTVKNVQLRGEGALKKAFEDLKVKLQTEGLFASQHKRPLPRFPESIGIITSGEGAAINDIQKVINGRWGGLKLYLLPVLVQGKNAPSELVAALNYFNAHHHVDVIIFGRGGGSLEDLQAFNSERVARAIFSSRIPIVAGIGHEHNTSIADLVADMRAATPSNAAELAVPDRRTIAHEISLIRHRATQTVENKLRLQKQVINQEMQTLKLFMSSRVHDIKMLIHTVHQGIRDRLEIIKHMTTETGLLRQKLDLAMRKKVETNQQKVHEFSKLLSALNPKNVVKRGYSITFALETGKPVTRLADVPPDGRIRTQVSDGVFVSSTKNILHQESLFDL